VTLLLSSTDARRALERSNTVVVLGAHPDLARPAGYVTAYLAQVGYAVTAVNPAAAGQALASLTIGDTLRGLGDVDLLVIFRRAEALPGHLDDILTMRPLPTTVWLQLGIRNDAFALALSQAGIDVVQDRCTLADHRAFGLPKRPQAA
jgi:predicted CoA-binding protein